MKSQETFEKVLNQVITYQIKETAKNWRIGQTWYNAFHEINMRLACEIIDTEIDPYYHDDRLSAFCEYLLKLDN